MSRKGEAVGLRTVTEACLGSTLYPAFWVTKKRHRWRYPDPPAAQRQALVERDIANTRHAQMGRLAHLTERALLRRGVRPRFGIREITVFEQPQS